MINDPVAQQNFILHPEEKTAEKVGKPFGKMKGGMPGERHGWWKGNAESWEARAAASGNFKKEDLGTQTIAGVSAQGTRYAHYSGGTNRKRKTDHDRFRALVLQ
jgi:hypothetical protein